MWFKKDIVIPTAREVSLRRVLGKIDFELDMGKMIRTQIIELRACAAGAVEALIEFPNDSMEIPLVIFGDQDLIDARFCPEAVMVVTAELEALGYVTFGEANGYGLNVALPLPPAAQAPASALRLVK